MKIDISNGLKQMNHLINDKILKRKEGKGRKKRKGNGCCECNTYGNKMSNTRIL